MHRHSKSRWALSAKIVTFIALGIVALPACSSSAGEESPAPAMDVASSDPSTDLGAESPESVSEGADDGVAESTSAQSGSVRPSAVPLSCPGRQRAYCLRCGCQFTVNGNCFPIFKNGRPIRPKC
jgi:hypothetical protein